MLKTIFTLLFLLGILRADPSPIVGYERQITKTHQVQYVQKEGNFSTHLQRLIDTDNIYNKGMVDNYDDPYIASIMKVQKVFHHIDGISKKNIMIAFKGKANKENFLKEFGLEIFTEQNLSISLIQMDAAKITLPMQPKVYPLFVMGSRYVQGVINRKILMSLVEESDYNTLKENIAIEALYLKLNKKFNRNKEDIFINYNHNKKLFEIRKSKESKIHSYISKEGRYILVL